MLVVTEYTKISPKDVEDYREYVWKPTVDSIRRPVKSVALQGVIITVHGNSGLIKRCNKCKSYFMMIYVPINVQKKKVGGGISEFLAGFMMVQVLLR